MDDFEPEQTPPGRARRLASKLWAIIMFDGRSYGECIAIAGACLLTAAIMHWCGASDGWLMIPFVPGIAAACAAQAIRQLGHKR